MCTDSLEKEFWIQFNLQLETFRFRKIFKKKQTLASKHSECIFQKDRAKLLKRPIRYFNKQPANSAKSRMNTAKSIHKTTGTESRRGVDSLLPTYWLF